MRKRAYIYLSAMGYIFLGALKRYKYMYSIISSMLTENKNESLCM